MILGFSTGCLYKTHNRLSPKTVGFFRELGCNAIEFIVHETKHASELLELTRDDLAGFDYISIHAPSFNHLKKEEYEKALGIFHDFSKKHLVRAVVIHPDEIDDWKMFDQFDLPFAIENMDNMKQSCRNVEDLKKVFIKKDVPMVLDVNHCFSNDPSMKLAVEFVEEFEGRIREIHLSGFETFHNPIHKTRQMDILNAIPDKNLPIIIESVLDDEHDAKREFEYVRNFLDTEKS